MKENFGPMNRHWENGPHFGFFLPVIVPLAIGFMIGVRKGRMQGGFGRRGNWENGVPPFFAELHRRAHAAQEQPQTTEA